MCLVVLDEFVGRFIMPLWVGLVTLGEFCRWFLIVVCVLVARGSGCGFGGFLVFWFGAAVVMQFSLCVVDLVFAWFVVDFVCCGLF